MEKERMVKRARNKTHWGRKRTLSVNGLLTRDLLQHTSSLGDSIARLTNANVDDELLNADVTHGVSLLALQQVRTIATTPKKHTIVIER